jgi:exopolyphosphatase/guanosine-5'-triphosphate,3'-diphosphate pyrophosphatase
VKPDILAAIDIGSNAVRLLINNVEPRDNGYDFKKTAYLRVPLRLGEDVFTRHLVSEAKAERLVEAMRGFGHLMRAFAVSGFRACATSAVRDAANGEALMRAVKEKTGIDVEIVSGKQEAELICAAGAARNASGKDSACLYADVGGGSTELAVYADQRMRFHDSFRIGTVRMLSDAVEEAEIIRFSRSLKEICAVHAPEDIVASGGNINKIHKMLSKKGNGPLLRGELEALHEKLRPLSIRDRMRDFGLNDYRADVIVPALEIFMSIGRQCPSLRAVHVPKIGLADGLIKDMHARRLRWCDARAERLACRRPPPDDIPEPDMP